MNPKIETLIHEGACIHYIWNAGEPKVTITSINRGDVEFLPVLEKFGLAGERMLKEFTDAVLADNVGRE